MHDPLDMKVVSKRRCIDVVGHGVVEAAERNGIVKFEATLTGRKNASPREFAALVELARLRTGQG